MWLLAGGRAPLRLLTLLPVAASACDYVENIAAWTLLGGSGQTWAPHLLQAGSLGKTVLSWASWLTLLALAAWRAEAAWRRGGGVRSPARRPRLRVR